MATKRKAKVKKKGYEPYKSWDEYYFEQWCVELAKENFIESSEYEPYPFILSEGLRNRFTVETKVRGVTKFVDKEEVILNPYSYTPDFLIFWRPESRKKLYQILNEGQKIICPFIGHEEDEGPYSFVEIKPDFDRHNMTRLFINNQKDVWEKYEKFVNLIKISELFAATFTPKAYLKTPTGLKRKPKWKVQTIKQFIK